MGRETAQVRSPLTVGQFAGKWCSYNAPPDLPYDQREEDGGSLVFDTPPLQTEQVKAGDGRWELSRDLVDYWSSCAS